MKQHQHILATKAAKTAKTDVALVKELIALIVIMEQRVQINIKIKRFEKF
jgi:hypothetical protein